MNQDVPIRTMVVPKSSIAPTVPCDLVIDDLWCLVADEPHPMILTPREAVREAIAWIVALTQKAGMDEARSVAFYITDLDTPPQTRASIES